MPVRKAFGAILALLLILLTTISNISALSLGNITSSRNIVSSSDLLISEVSKTSIREAKTFNSSVILNIQVSAIHIDKAEFPISKLLFKLTLKLALVEVEKRLQSRRVKLSLSIRSANTCSNQYAGAVAAEEYYLKKARLFIVSGCDAAIRGVSRLASGWRVPVMTAAGFGVDLNDKSVHRSLIRVAFSLRTAVKFMVKILKLFSWHRVNLIVDESDANSIALKDGIEKHMLQLKSSDFQLDLNIISLDLQSLVTGGENRNNESSTISSNQRAENLEDKWANKVTEQAVHDVLRQSAFFSRVNILLIPQNHIRKFMLSVYDQNMANGLYTFINIPLLLGGFQPEEQNESSTNGSYSKQSYTSSTGDNVFVWRSLKSSRNAQAKQAFESLMSIYLKTPTTKAYVYFAGKLLNLANLDYRTTTMSPLLLKNSTKSSDQASAKIQLNINPYSASFYDCVQIYSYALEESFTLIEKHVNQTNRRKMMKELHQQINRLIRDRRYDNMITGSIVINENGDREADYTLDDLNPMTGKYAPVILFKGDSKEIERISRIHWSSDMSVGPTVDNIECILNDSCASKPISKFLATLIIISVPVAFLVFLILYFVYSRLNLESQLVDYWWKIDYKDIELVEARRKHAGKGSSSAMSGSQTSSFSRVKKIEANDDITDISDKAAEDDPAKLEKEQAKTSVTRVTTTSGFGSTAADACYGDISLGIYKLNKVALKPITKFHQSRKLMIELRTIKTISHSNLCRLVGIVVDEPNTSLVNEFCPKGSLREFFQNESMVIDLTFKYSIINDILAGLTYIHSSPLEYHGRLKSSNCLVSSRFVVKLSDFGLRSLYDQLDSNEDELEQIRRKIFSAPEHLKLGSKSGSIKGDIYSFGLLLYEIITNRIPFYNDEINDFLMPLKTLHTELKDSGITERTLPDLGAIELGQNNIEVLVDLMRSCWNYDSTKRPSLQETNTILRRITKGVTSKKLLENLTGRMEQYTNNLESLVEAKLATLVEEKLKTEELLYQFVPKSIASLLKEGQSVEPEAFECVTVFYSDIVGFTSLSSESSPMEVIDFLSELYLCFDETLEHYDIFKVDTIGDAYIVASGLPLRNEGKHVIEIARAALDLRDRIANFKIPHKPGRSLQMRVGINSGPCIAGIVGGLNMPKYCVFGDTLTTGKFMESSGLPMKIHITEDSKVLLDKVGGFTIVPRVPKINKDGLSLQTYWLEK